MRSPEIASLVLAASLALPLAVGPTAEATIALDASFGEGGKVVAPITSFTGASDVAILADGKFVATGAGPASDLTVARFHPDGSLDASFGTGGMAVASFIDPTFGRLTSAGQRILVQGDRKVVAVGFADASDREIALARFDEQGRLDGTFGNGGMVRTPIGIADPPFGGHGARDVADAALQADEKILVVSNVTGSIGHTQAYARGFLLRYDTRGSLDATFGAGGVLLARPADPRVYAYGSAVAVQEDGKIVTAGFFVAGTSGAYRYGSLIRHDQRGNLDLTFGDRGLAPNVTTARPGIQFSQKGLIFDRAGRLLIGGGVIDGGTDAFGLLRYNASGALDSTFGTDGLAITSIQTHSFMNALTLSGDSVIGGGQSETFAPSISPTRPAISSRSRSSAWTRFRRVRSPSIPPGTLCWPYRTRARRRMPSRRLEKRLYGRPCRSPLGRDRSSSTRVRRCTASDGVTAEKPVVLHVLATTCGRSRTIQVPRRAPPEPTRRS